MHTPRILLPSLALSILLACVAARAQEPKPETQPADMQTSTLKVTSRLVVLDVVVTDKAGANRNDLTKDDFHITEDGASQTILSFEPPPAHTLPPITLKQPINSTADLEREAPQAPVNIIVLDEMNTSFNDMAYARYSLKKYLNAQPDQVQSPTMLTAISFDKFTVLKDYTQDRQAILDALNKHLTHYPWNLQRGESPILHFAKSLGALEQVATGTAGHPGHKNVIWVGKGFKGINLSSPNISSGAVSGITFAVQQAVNMLRDSRITLYMIDPTILTSEVANTVDADSIMGIGDAMDATAPDPFAGDVNFVGLAKSTGGKAFYNRNDVDREIGTSVRDGMNYYTISYRPTNSSEEERPYRKIRVAFAMPGLHAGYRDGYYVKDNPVATEGKYSRLNYDMNAAEISTLVYTGLHVIAEAKPGASGTYLVGVPQSNLTWVADGETEIAKIKVVALSLDGKGKMLRRATEEVTARRPLGVASKDGLAKVQLTLPSAPGAYRLRFVVRGDADGKIGTADLMVPGAPAPPKPER